MWATAAHFRVPNLSLHHTGVKSLRKKKVGRKNKRNQTEKGSPRSVIEFGSAHFVCTVEVEIARAGRSVQKTPATAAGLGQA